MSIPHLCILLAALLPYLTTGLAKTAPGFNNREPRPWLANLRGWQARAYAAHLNSFEAFPLFAVAVILAELHHVDGQLLNQLSGGFVVARVLYIISYISDHDRIRSVLWLVGIACCIGLLAHAA